MDSTPGVRRNADRRLRAKHGVSALGSTTCRNPNLEPLIEGRQARGGTQVRRSNKRRCARPKPLERSVQMAGPKAEIVRVTVARHRDCVVRISAAHEHMMGRELQRRQREGPSGRALEKRRNTPHQRQSGRTGAGTSRCTTSRSLRPLRNSDRTVVDCHGVLSLMVGFHVRGKTHLSHPRLVLRQRDNARLLARQRHTVSGHSQSLIQASHCRSRWRTCTAKFEILSHLDS